MLKFRRILFNNSYVNNLYEHYQKNPQSVGDAWKVFFSQQGSQPTQSLQEQSPQIELLYKTYYMFRTFYVNGHLLASLDPLKLEKAREFGKLDPVNTKWDLLSFGFQESQLDTPIYFGNVEQRQYIYPFMVTKEEWTIREIYDRLKRIYSSSYGIEYVHMVEIEQKHWIEVEMERLANFKSQTQKKTWKRLAKTDQFNEFLKNRFTTSKRFGVEGIDTLIVGLEALVDQAAQNGIENVIMGMAHRGRLSTLANVFNKPLEIIFAEFQNKYSKESEESWGNIGDVKYHLGTTREKKFPNGHSVLLTMLPNPSHLEAVNPVVMGKTRALQDLSDELKSVGVIIHGDAAMAGQGVVYEHLQMQNLKGFANSGTIHIVANNQIGFTTKMSDGRSGYYCTDVAKSIGAPIFHVNADDPDMVDEIFKVALRFRQQFKKDVVVDLVGYRRYGHNEQDQPAFTQPKMYEIINKTKPVYHLYTEQLKKEGVINDEFIDKELKEIQNLHETAYKAIQQQLFNKDQWVPKPWEKLKQVSKFGKVKDTGISLDEIKLINKVVNVLPEDFQANQTVRKIYEARKQSLEVGKGIDFATAEALAFGSLLNEGFSVRLTGQDVERGTFSHRHAVINDQKRDIKYCPLRQLLPSKAQNRIDVYNSHLSEYAVLGYEYGYSTSNPNTLSLWEAQFGDFANGAQIIIDNFISSGEAKWNTASGLVMLLPHGFDGQGPEHSSARIERFLQLMDDDPSIVLTNTEGRVRRQILNSNFQVVVCSNAANYFHSLRRQLRRDFRKPLIVFESKKLLKFQRASSDLSLFLEGTRFHRLIPDTHEEIKPANLIKKVVLCYGQVYYDIIEKRKELKRDDVAVIRIEQLAPFPYDHFREVAKNYTNAQFLYCQEEHQNAGGWYYLEPRIQNVLNLLKQNGLIKNPDLHYVGRKPSASTAAGSPSNHKKELETFLSKLYS